MNEQELQQKLIDVQQGLDKIEGTWIATQLIHRAQIEGAIEALRAIKAAMDQFPPSFYDPSKIDHRYLESNVNAAYSALIDAFGVLGVDILAESNPREE